MQSRSSEAQPSSGTAEEISPPRWDHDHCDFCFAKLMDTSRFDGQWRQEHPDVLNAGYTPAPSDESFGSVWVCPACFEDFRARFGWTVIDAP
jgi:hypothetical protein